MTISSRREFLQTGGLGFGGLALGELLRNEARGQAASAANPLLARPAHLPGTARNVIFLFMQ
ncbi:MAG: sulfatase, partial [Planctomycetaceae bacterium]|nr:sulfatase [Planctomycetaceae bacterium]